MQEKVPKGGIKRRVPGCLHCVSTSGNCFYTIARASYRLGLRQGHRSMCIQGRSCLRSEGPYPSTGQGYAAVRCLTMIRGSPFATLRCLLFNRVSSWCGHACSSSIAVPRTNMFFSGNLLALATLSSIELHMSLFLSPSSGPAEVEVYVENRFVFAVMFALCQLAASPALTRWSSCRFVRSEVVRRLLKRVSGRRARTRIDLGKALE